MKGFTITLAIVALIVICYGIISDIHHKNVIKKAMKKCKDKMQIGDRYKQIIPYDDNPFNEHLDIWMTILDIKDNDKGETWVKYMVDGWVSPSVSKFEHIFNWYKMDE